jgi:beta-N-acetylhexosaminidase
MNRLTRHERLAGSLVLAGFEGLCLPTELKRLLKQDALSGIILFKRNVDSIEQVRAVNDTARSAVMSPGAMSNASPIIAVDQEGGRVARIKAPLTHIPSARRFGEKNDPSLTKTAGLLVGRELSALGFTLNFAPVLDVDTNPASPVIGDRSYGDTPDTVIQHGLAFAEGLKAGGVMPCAKHFPGHGDAAVDSHLALPRVPHDSARLDVVEMSPFRAWSKAKLGPVMTAHVMYPALDAHCPATLSASIIEGELRHRIGFKGPVLTDDLEMGAMADFGGPGGAAVRAVRAGADGLLVCRMFEHVEAVIAGLAKEALDDSSFSSRLEKAALRLLSLRNLPKGDLTFIGSSAHMSLSEEVMSAFK